MEKKEEDMSCPRCHSLISQQALFCSQCGFVLKEKASPLGNPLDAKDMDSAQKVPFSFRKFPSSFANDKIAGIPKHWFYLILGLLLAPIFQFFPILNYMGWFLESLLHEMGHCVVAFFFGCIAIPAIRLDGHAAAFHYDQNIFLAFVVWNLLGYATYHFGKSKRFSYAYLMGALAILYPLLAFTQAREFFHLVGGHGGELIFASVFFWRALVGGFYEEKERPCYAMLAWYIWGQNIFLCWNLMYSQETRFWYMTSGSFGLENDYIRIAALLGWELQSVALMMLFVSVLLPPLGMVWGFWSHKEGDAE